MYQLFAVRFTLHFEIVFFFKKKGGKCNDMSSLDGASEAVPSYGEVENRFTYLYECTDQFSEIQSLKVNILVHLFSHSYYVTKRLTTMQTN